MIRLITGKKGSGKTKIIIDRINTAVKNTNGCLVCIEKGETLRRSISYKVRWCDTEQFAIDTFDAFYGFVAGMLAGNYDIKEIYVDGILKIGLRGTGLHSGKAGQADRRRFRCDFHRFRRRFRTAGFCDQVRRLMGLDSR